MPVKTVFGGDWFKPTYIALLAATIRAAKTAGRR